ncbi:acyl-CoA dehydrogenase family protein [Cryptosporangium minutisporangium]|uniref:Acyl-CoA dehydrogenase family protein n=1 Tax=Cryptosporangium minutisporangium TaxID=113569 RepID=A0ABP6SUH5_9ACTN
MDFTPDPPLRDAAELAALVVERSAQDELWAALVDAGLVELALPAEVGGDDLGPAGAAVVLTELGRRAVSTPLYATLALGALTLSRCGAGASLLRRVVDDGAVLSAALHEPSTPFPDEPRTLAVPGADGYRVSGVKLGVPDADAAERILVPVTRSPGGPALLLVDPSAPGVQVSRVPGAGPNAPFRLGLDAVAVPADALVGGPAAIAELYRLAVAGAVSYGDGLLAGALALTTAHVASRQQFGRPLATFQAVAQQIADVYLASRTMHLLAQSTVWRLQTGADPGTDAEVAAYWVATALPAALGTCHHLHGGLGLDRDYPLHRFSAAASDLARLVGGSDATLDLLGARYLESKC